MKRYCLKKGSDGTLCDYCTRNIVECVGVPIFESLESDRIIECTSFTPANYDCKDVDVVEPVKINKYVCKCGHFIIVRDSVPRVTTPFVLLCPKCGDSAYSSMYTCPQDLEPQFEWFIPTTVEELSEAYKDFTGKELQAYVAKDCLTYPFLRRLNR